MNNRIILLSCKDVVLIARAHKYIISAEIKIITMVVSQYNEHLQSMFLVRNTSIF